MSPYELAGVEDVDGRPGNFGITVALGFIVGAAIAGQTFYLFTVENLRQFGSLKAMGVENGRLVGMILFQAAVVDVMGFGIGIGGGVVLRGDGQQRSGSPPRHVFALAGRGPDCRGRGAVPGRYPKGVCLVIQAA